MVSGPAGDRCSLGANICGLLSHTWRSTAALLENATSALRVTKVGGGSSILPLACRSSAACAESQRCSDSSEPSARTSTSSPHEVTKNQVAKRRERPFGVVQCERG